MRAFLRIAPVIICCSALRAFPAVPELDNLGQSFYSPKAFIQWDLKTNPLPPTVRIQKLVPATIDEQVISKLLHLGRFTETDRVYRDVLGSKIQKDTFSYRSADDRSSLGVIPAQGIIELYSPRMSTSMPEGVPNEARALQLGINLLQALRLPMGQFITQAGGQLRTWFYPGSITHFVRMEESITRPCSMGIEFRRQFDGIPCFQERFHAEFEGDEKLTQMEVRWHAVQPSAPVSVSTTNQISTWITEGRTRVQSLEVAGPGGRRLQPRDIKKLTIKEIVPHYSGPAYHISGSFDERAATALFPYAILTAEAELGPGDKELIFLFVPLTAEALMKQSRKTEKYGFAIYPSARYEKQRQSYREAESK